MALAGSGGSSGGGGGSFSAVAAPATLQSITSVSPGSTVTVSGGTSPFIYQWTRISGSGVAPTDATVSSTTFYSTVGVPVEQDATFSCAVQDANGLVAYTNDVIVIVYQGQGG